MRSRPDQGFSLLELLIVLVMMGLIAGVGYASLRGMMERNRLETATTQVANSLIRARSHAQTKNVTASWTKLSDASYQLMLGTTAKQYDLPRGLKFSSLPDGTQVVYSAPYGEVSVNGSAVGALKITIVNGKGASAEIHVVGVTGKVIKR